MNRPSAVIEVAYSFGYGGAERVGSSLAEYFHRQGIATGAIALYSGEGPISEQLNSVGIPTLALGGAVVRGRPVPILFRRRLLAFLDQFGACALHVHQGLCLGIVRRFLRHINCSRVVYTEHSTDALSRIPRYRSNVARWASADADVVTVLHSQMRDYFVDQLGVLGHKVVTIPNGVSPRELPQHAQERAPNRPVKLIWVGRMHPDKDLATLLAAFELAVAQSPVQIVLQLVGDGEERAKLEQYVSSRQIASAVQFLGFRSDIGDLLTESDIFVLSSRTEGLPLVILEAMAAGLPCIATDVGGVRDCVTEEVGRLVPARDPSAFASAIVELASSSSLRAAMGLAGYQNTMANFQFDQVARQYAGALGLSLPA